MSPGMIGAMVRHLKSLRRMTRDHGWIHTLLEEAENERMHLLTALELRRPGPLFKIAVIGTQGEPLKERAYEIPRSVYFTRASLLTLWHILTLACHSQNLLVLLSLPRCVCEYVLDSVFPQSQILPQVCWLLGGRGSQDLHSLH